MRLTVEKSLATLEEKVSINLLSQARDCTIGKIKHVELNDKNIYVINDFLLKSECNEIIAAATDAGFQKLSNYDNTYRDAERILAFDKNNVLVNTINNRLNSKLVKKLNKNKIDPYGFFVDQYKWSDIIGINECLRISKYKKSSTGFNWHRDAQYTNQSIRSVYSIVIYLSDSSDLEFIAPNNYYSHDGYTIVQEMKLISKPFESYTVTPKRGMAIVFDQRLIHKAHPCTKDKYLVRTDILVRGTKKKSYAEDDLELRIMELTQKLFRQAQYYELNEENDKAKELYEICLSLRQKPAKIKQYPKRLEKMLCHMDIKVPVSMKYTLILVSRNGAEYIFRYENIDKRVDMYNALRLCALLQLSSMSHKLSGDSGKYLEIVSDNIGILKQSIKFKGDTIETDGFDEYYYNKFEATPSEEITDHDFKAEFADYISDTYGLKILTKTRDMETHTFVNIEADSLIHVQKQRGHCGLSDSSSCDDTKYEYYNNEKFVFDKDNLGIVFEPITETNGIIHIRTIADSFNHASCNCETYYKHCDTGQIIIPVTIQIFYKINLKKKLITTQCTPNIII